MFIVNRKMHTYRATMKFYLTLHAFLKDFNVIELNFQIIRDIM